MSLALEPTAFGTTWLSASPSRAGGSTYPAGPWDEASLWLFGDGPADEVQPPARVDQRTEPSGYVALRSASGLAFTRCGAFKHRPSHADLLHVDVWWRGINVALDAGTYGYNSPAPWDGGLAGTSVHNTLTIDGRDQMDKAGRFLWLPWARGTSRAIVGSDGGSLAYWEGEHDGYARLPEPATHRRGVLRVGEEHWLVLDESRSAAEHDHRLHWLLADMPFWVTASAEGTAGGRVTLGTSEGPYAVVVGSWRAEDGLGAVGGDEPPGSDDRSPLGAPLHPSWPHQDMSVPDQVVRSDGNASASGPLSRLGQKPSPLDRGLAGAVVDSSARGVFDVVRADLDSTRGWRSAYYLDREPAVSVTFQVRAATLRLWTLLGPVGATVEVGEDELRMDVGGTRVEVRLGRSEDGPMVTSVAMSGEHDDVLVVGR